MTHDEFQNYISTIQKKRRLFLLHILDGKTVTDAAKAVGVANQTPYNWRYKSAEYDAAWNYCEDVKIRNLESAVGSFLAKFTSRCVDNENPGWARVYAPYIKMMLQAHNPQKYSDKSEVHNVNEVKKEIVDVELPNKDVQS